MVKNSNILITGGTGSLGKSLIEFLLDNENEYKPKTIKILSRDEDKQYWLKHLYKNSQHISKIQFIIGDIRSFPTIVSALQNIDVVIHAAAMKQVPICEEFPYEAVQTNIIGSHNIVSAIEQYKIPVKKVIGLSTDKSCDPINVYGMTKFIQEKLFLLANKNCSSTDFITVRYGNVLGSRGSVIPLFKEQIKQGGPITITDTNMTRFFFSMQDAIDTIMAALQEAKKGETFVPKIKSFSIRNLAEAMVGGRNIPIIVTGIRPGEKLHETLISKNETDRTYGKIVNSKYYYIIKPCFDQPVDEKCINEYTSKDNINSLKETYELLTKNSFL